MRFFRVCVLNVILMLFFSASVHARSIEEIKASGVINIAVKADYKPYGFKSSDGKNVGLEIDLANDVAKDLGVSVNFLDVTSKTRMQTLLDGTADVMIATMTDKPERRKIINVIDVPYYSSGTNIMFPKNTTVKTWADIRGKTLCGTEGASYNNFVMETFGAKITAHESNNDNLKALSEGKCDGFVFDDSYILSKLSEEEWAKDFAMPLDTIDDAPWTLGVQPGQQDMYDLMKAKVIQWHKSKFILSLEEKYGIKPSIYAVKMSQLF